MCDPCFKYGRPPPPPQPSSNAAPVPNATRTLRPTNRPAEGQHRAALHLPLCPTEDGRDTLPRLEYRLQVPRQRQEAEGGQLDSTSTGSSAARCDDRQGSTPHHIGRCGCICTGMACNVAWVDYMHAEHSVHELGWADCVRVETQNLKKRNTHSSNNSRSSSGSDAPKHGGGRRKGQGNERNPTTTKTRQDETGARETKDGRRGQSTGQ